MAVNAGYCFSFIKPHIQELKVVNVANKGSQFRSRDFYPQAIAAYLNHQNVLGKNLSLDDIPDAPSNRIAWIDGYGNIKTTIRNSSLKIPASTKVKVTINRVTRTAMLERGIFAVSEGELSFSPGSSGHNDRFMELILRGGSAASLFDHPKTNTKITIGSLV
jgi:hypothetical protein